MKKIIGWIITNTAYVAVIYLAINGSVGCKNVVVFMTWLSVIAYWQINDSLKKEEDTYVNKVGYMPTWIPNTLNIIILTVFIFHGWWVTGIAWFIASSFESDNSKKARALREVK